MLQKIMLIADSGSTKTTWALLSEGKQNIVRTQGLSPYFLSANEIRQVLLEELIPKLNLKSSMIEEIFFYGTGVAVFEKSKQVEEALSAVFRESKIEINHDLTGAARALCQRQEGMACILGTGSGVCYYDGRIIQEMSPGLGFILGDEGSGADLGKRLVRAYLYQILDLSLRKQFYAQYQLSKGQILEKIYEEDHPNRFLANFSKFIGSHRGHPQIEAILKECIHHFLNTHVLNYKQCKEKPIHLVGGVAYAFQEDIRQQIEEEGLRFGHVLKEPIEGLISYHKK